MTDLEKQYVRLALELLEDDHIDAAQALLEIIVAEDDVMQSHFLASVTNGEQTPLKLVESNIRIDHDGNIITMGDGIKGATAPVFVVVTK